MLRIFHDPQYDFVRWWRWAVGLTVAFIVIGMVPLATRGLNQSIEFTGGTQMQLEFKQPVDVGALRTAMDQAGFHGVEIQQFGADNVFALRAQDRAHVAAQTDNAQTMARQIESVLVQRFGAGQFEIVRTEAVGPRVGEELTRGAIIAMLLSFLITLVYLAVRFEWRFGLAAIVATGHDLIATIAFIAMIHLEISLTVIAALLTVVGYSLNDTIIIFDRVRENLRKGRKESLYDTLNRSINETLPRSVMTHATTLAATLALLFFAGEVIRPFAWVMAFGIFTGTFSSIYVAGPVLLWIERKYPRKAIAWQPSSTATPTSRTQSSPVTATR